MMANDRNSKNIGFPAQLGIFFGLMGAGIIMGSLISGGAWLMMTGRPILSMETDMLKPEYYNAAMAMQVIFTLFWFFIPVYSFAFICYRRPAAFLGFNTKINVRQFFVLMGILILTFPLSGALAELNTLIPIPAKWAAEFKLKEESRAAMEAALINVNSFPRYIISLIVVGLLPGLFEEIAFRAGLQNILTRWFKGPWIAIIVTAFLFSAIHISYYGFLVRFALGIILGFIFYYSGNIWLSVITHFLYNAVGVTFIYIFTISGAKNQKDIEKSFPLWTGLVALVFIIYLFIQFRKISLSEKAKIAEDDFPEDDFHNWAATHS